MTRRSVSFLVVNAQLPNAKYFKPLQEIVSRLSKIKEKSELRNYRSEKINEYVFLEWLVKTLSDISLMFLGKISSDKLENAINTVYLITFLDIAVFKSSSELKITEILNDFYATLTMNPIFIDEKTEKGFVNAADSISNSHANINDLVRFKKLFFQWLFQESFPQSGENAHRILINNLISHSYSIPTQKEKPESFFSKTASISSSFFSPTESSKRLLNDAPPSSVILGIQDAHSNADFRSLFSYLFELQCSSFSNVTQFQYNFMKKLIQQFWAENQAFTTLDAALATKNPQIPQEYAAQSVPERSLNSMIQVCFFDLQPNSSFVSSLVSSQRYTPENLTPVSNHSLGENPVIPTGSFRVTGR